MIETTWVWIPSLQRYVRFRMISSKQQKIISMHLETEDDFEFCKITTDLIEENIAEEGHNVRTWTILDKFFILLQLRINSIGSILSTTVKEIDLNEFVKNVAAFVDHHFQYQLNHNGIIYNCTLPSIQNELEIYGMRKSIDDENERLVKMICDDQTWGYLQSIEIAGQTIGLFELGIAERTQTLNAIPSIVLERIKKEFIRPINNTISYEGFLEWEDTKLDFDLSNYFIIAKFFLTYTLKNIHEEYHFLVKQGYDLAWIERQPAGDRITHLNIIKKRLEEEAGQNDEMTRQLSHQ